MDPREVMLLLVMAHDSFSIQRIEPCSGSITIGDVDRLGEPLRFWPYEIDQQQPVLQVRAQYFHPVGQHESTLELARGDAAIEIVVLLLVLLAPTDDQLALLDCHVELIAGEARDRQCDPQALGLAVLADNPFDIVGRIAVRGLGDTIERALDLVESEQEGAGQRRNSGHGLKALTSDFEGPLRRPLTARWTVPQGGPFANMGSSGPARKNAPAARAERAKTHRPQRIEQIALPQY